MRTLNSSEIKNLVNQGCYSSDWSKISVTEGFSTEHIFNVRFRGKVVVGKLGSVINEGTSGERISGLYNSMISDCVIGNDVCIDDVHLVQNYMIEEGVILENVDTIKTNGRTSFGNGVEMSVLNEAGGRELLLFDTLNAQLAYLLVFYRHDPDLITAINSMIRHYSDLKSSDMGQIGKGTVIENAGTLMNVMVGEHVTVTGASLLENGTIVSNSQASVKVGEDVIARNFIIQTGSRVEGGALLENCFVGQSVEIGKQFSGENSVFFANSEAFHGEAVSVFAGPYTVTHHKSTLLIAGMFSFYNAGSGTNQSNHMYKLGPVHQGIVERGSKTGSFSYLLWPSHIGAYSVIMGKNMTNFDSSDFPFSYINAEHDRSLLTPGMNLFTVGTRRDSEKWPTRDKRKDPEKRDLINFDFLSPFVIQKVIRALQILSELYEKASKKQETVYYKGIRIKRLMLRSTRKYYEMALDIFIGQQLFKKLEQINVIKSKEDLRKLLKPSNEKVTEKWIDLSGMIAPEHLILELIGKIKTGALKNLDEIFSEFKLIHESYDNYAWDWTVKVLEERYGIDIAMINPDQVSDLLSTWETESVKLDKMILNDAAKEFDDNSRISYGIVGGKAETDKDFEEVRGNPEKNKFISGIKQEIEEIARRSASVKSLLKKI